MIYSVNVSPHTAWLGIMSRSLLWHSGLNWFPTDC